MAAGIKAFLTVATTDGQKGLEEIGYTPIPDSVQDQPHHRDQRHLLVRLPIERCAATDREHAQ